MIIDESETAVLQHLAVCTSYFLHKERKGKVRLVAMCHWSHVSKVVQLPCKSIFDRCGPDRGVDQRGYVGNSVLGLEIRVCLRKRWDCLIHGNVAGYKWYICIRKMGNWLLYGNWAGNNLKHQTVIQHTPTKPPGPKIPRILPSCCGLQPQGPPIRWDFKCLGGDVNLNTQIMLSFMQRKVWTSVIYVS